MKKLFLGHSPLTTLSGYIVSILYVVKDLNTAGTHNWQDYLLPAAVALLGRLSKDDRNSRPQPPLIAPSKVEDQVLSTSKPGCFFRRGKEHKQNRGRNGRFATSVG
jgi:hypothetical protein